NTDQQERVKQFATRFKRELWTRVKGRSQIDTLDSSSYSIASDLEAYVRRERWTATHDSQTGEVIFNPDDYTRQGQNLEVQQHTLSQAEKQHYAHVSIGVRQKLLARANELAEKRSADAFGSIAEAT
ncbi:MAG: hypothetical protein VYC68_04605, partial [Candidatus Thermoplasmatota archaeon]|nr:hypothetical protein [Candidatus Thermoplasmatota archaeon]